MNMDWQVAPASPSSYIVKKVLRLEIPVYSYPNVSNIRMHMWYWCLIPLFSLNALNVKKLYLYMFTGHLLHIVRLKGTKITPLNTPPPPQKKKPKIKIWVVTSFNMFQFNFVGRLLGPRGNSLKRVEASTGCRVFIRGKGSIKDPDKVLTQHSLNSS